VDRKRVREEGQTQSISRQNWLDDFLPSFTPDPNSAIPDETDAKRSKDISPAVIWAMETTDASDRIIWKA